ncbi:MAG: hypothetical protein ACE5H3_03990 [Planctomycetota bacterium]
MASSGAPLPRALEDLARSLEREWSADSPPIPPALREYRKEWLDTMLQPVREISLEETALRLGRGRPVVVGDFHPSGRARRNLGSLLAGLRGTGRLGLILELLPASLVRPAALALRDPGPRLPNGERLVDAFRGSLEVLAASGGIVAGGWEPGEPQERDLAAARTWRRLRVRFPDTRWVLYFGDWHLAGKHLPRALRAEGGRPVMLHQSPEPLWKRFPGPLQERFLDLGSDHLAWLHTPPLSHWARLLQNREGDRWDPCLEAEIAEELCESLMLRLASALGLPEPGGFPSVWPADEWEGFRKTLPPGGQAAYSKTPGPKAPVFHPHLPLIWFDRPPGLNALLEAAGHGIACDWALAGQQDLLGRLVARAFRRLWAVRVNPLLLPADPEDLARRLFPGQRAGYPGELVERAATELARGRVPALEGRPAILAVEILGARLGHGLAAREDLDRSWVRQLLQGGWKPLDWEALAATIRAA